jgi:hypothetical protein
LKKILLAVLLLAGRPAAALEFEGGDQAAKSAPAPPSSSGQASVPQLIDAGDVPTAYALLKYEMRADIRFYPDGGILNKVDLGIFPRFFIGGGLNVPGLVSAGPVNLNREDASFLARLVVIQEDDSTPSVALGWDGPEFDGAELRGLYLSLSKEFKTPLGFFQAHGGLNSSYLDNGWMASRDLRGFAALTSSFRQVTGFFEGDEINNPLGPRLNAGLRYFFDPISLGIEFRDLGATREGVVSSRMLRVSYSGLF